MKKLVNGAPAEVHPTGEVQVESHGDRLLVRTPEGLHTALVVRRGADVLVSWKGHQHIVSPFRSRAAQDDPATSGELKAPLPGQVVEVLRKEGDEVKKGDRILVLEAMKMQQIMAAPFDGVVDRISVQQGQQVTEGLLLAHILPKND